MRNLNILLDTNGVLFDSDAFMLKYAVKYFKKKYNMDIVNPNGYGIKEIFNCSKEQEQKFWSKHKFKYLLFYKPRKDMIDAINKLRSEGNKVYNATVVRVSKEGKYINIIMKKAIEILYKTGLWLHKVKFDGVQVFLTLDDDEYKCDIDKLNFIKENNIDVVVDDKKGNVLEFSKISGLSVLCMDTINNKNIDDENIKRIYHGNHFYTETMKHKDKINGTSSIFSTFVNPSKEEKKNFTVEQRKEYNKQYREYLMQLPFDLKEMKKGERNFKLMSKTLGLYGIWKWKPQIINEELLPKDKGVILVSNHPTKKDPALLLSSINNLPWHILAKKELSEGLVSKAFDAIYPVYVDRKNDISRKESMIEMGKVLVHGGTMLIFPEGTNTPNLTDGNLGAFDGHSPFYLSQALDRYIIPMATTYKNDKVARTTVRLGEHTKVELDEDLDQAKMRIWNYLNNMIEENKQNDAVKILKK